MRSLLRQALGPTMFALAFTSVAACALSDEQPALIAPPAPDPVVVPAELTVAATPQAGQSHPITDAELAEVRRDPKFAEAMEILAEDGESVKLDAGVTSVYEDDANSIDITFTPLDADGQPSRVNLEVVYQRISGERPSTYFVTDDATGARGAVAPRKDDGGPTAQLCIGFWTSWATSNHYCGYRWLCSKRKWDHQAWFRTEYRVRNCVGGGYQTQTRNKYEHCGC